MSATKVPVSRAGTRAGIEAPPTPVHRGHSHALPESEDGNANYQSRTESPHKDPSCGRKGQHDLYRFEIWIKDLEIGGLTPFGPLTSEPRKGMQGAIVL